jgi:hypothetical protein
MGGGRGSSRWDGEVGGNGRQEGGGGGGDGSGVAPVVGFTALLNRVIKAPYSPLLG